LGEVSNNLPHYPFSSFILPPFKCRNLKGGLFLTALRAARVLMPHLKGGLFLTALRAAGVLVCRNLKGGLFCRRYAPRGFLCAAI
jgi:hypothetical protein